MTEIVTLKVQNDKRGTANLSLPEKTLELGPLVLESFDPKTYRMVLGFGTGKRTGTLKSGKAVYQILRKELPGLAPGLHSFSVTPEGRNLLLTFNPAFEDRLKKIFA